MNWDFTDAAAVLLLLKDCYWCSPVANQIAYQLFFNHNFSCLKSLFKKRVADIFNL